MAIPTEPIGSIPRSANLLAAMSAHAAGRISRTELHAVEEHALRDTIARFEETGSPVITDGEQTKPSFATYPLAGLKNLAADGVVIPFARRAHPTTTQADGVPLPLWRPCSNLPQSCSGVHAPALETGGDLCIGTESALSTKVVCPAMRGRLSSKILPWRQSGTYVSAWRLALRACKSTSLRGDWRSSSIPRVRS